MCICFSALCLWLLGHLIWIVRNWIRVKEDRNQDWGQWSWACSAWPFFHTNLTSFVQTLTALECFCVTQTVLALCSWIWVCVAGVLLHYSTDMPQCWWHRPTGRRPSRDDVIDSESDHLLQPSSIREITFFLYIFTLIVFPFLAFHPSCIPSF